MVFCSVSAKYCRGLTNNISADDQTCSNLFLSSTFRLIRVQTSPLGFKEIFALRGWSLHKQKKKGVTFAVSPLTVLVGTVAMAAMSLIDNLFIRY